jgi:hypothetical protein
MAPWLISLGAIGVLVLTLLYPVSPQRQEAPAPAAEMLDKLRALPYLSQSPRPSNPKNSGVVRHLRGRTSPGYNFFFETDQNDRVSRGFLLDMNGDVVVEETADMNITLFSLPLSGSDWLKAIPSQAGIGRFTAGGELVWKRSNLKVHHEVTLSDRNTLLIDFREEHRYKGRLVIFDGIEELDLEDGRSLRRWSTWENLDALRQHHQPSVLDSPGGKMPKKDLYDYFHQNSIQALPDTPLGRKDRRFARGNWLVSLRNVDLVLILQRETMEILWSWGPGQLEWQHMPRMLSNGRILIFDNGTRRKWSRVIEMDPLTRTIVWEYKEDPPESFFSPEMGSVQRLPNGNTLIGDGANGRALEVTRDKQVVWEWFNPRIGPRGGRMSFYRITRIPPELVPR